PSGVSIPIVAYAVELDGAVLAVDCGLSSRFRGPVLDVAADEGPAAGSRYHPVLDGPTFAEQLGAEGLTAHRTICTHLHVDHAGGAREVGRPVEAAVGEIAAALSDGGGGYPTADLDGVQFVPLHLDRGPVGPFPAHAVLAPGLLALSTPGHSEGSISVFACLGGTWGLVCGDAVYPRADQPQSEAFLGMLRIRRALEELGATLVLAGHDTAALRACAGGAWLGN
ncbi:MAG: MBL fold metallo-hydrolase, partial [Candidatus Dormibacteraeota bacterium]|nr:MBL fold metallo-hydrolase [Candidatus Dormibacteraeota bacterium]